MVLAGMSGRCADSANSQAIRMTKAGLRNSDGWMLTPSDHEPAPRALDLGAEKQRRRDQHEADDEHDQREPADLPRRQERGRRSSRRAPASRYSDVAVDEIERIEAEPRRDRRARGQRQHDAGRASARRAPRASAGRPSTTSRQTACVQGARPSRLPPETNASDLRLAGGDGPLTGGRGRERRPLAAASGSRPIRSCAAGVSCACIVPQSRPPRRRA